MWSLGRIDYLRLTQHPRDEYHRGMGRGERGTFPANHERYDMDFMARARDVQVGQIELKETWRMESGRQVRANKEILSLGV